MLIRLVGPHLLTCVSVAVAVAVAVSVSVSVCVCVRACMCDACVCVCVIFVFPAPTDAPVEAGLQNQRHAVNEDGECVRHSPDVVTCACVCVGGCLVAWVSVCVATIEYSLFFEHTRRHLTDKSTSN